MSKQPSERDRIIGLAVGFLMLLVAAGILGMPLNDLILWGLIFTVIWYTLVLYLRRSRKDK